MKKIKGVKEKGSGFSHVGEKDRAKKLIENYINQIGEITDVKYNVTRESE